MEIGVNEFEDLIPLSTCGLVQSLKLLFGGDPRPCAFCGFCCEKQELTGFSPEANSATPVFWGTFHPPVCSLLWRTKIGRF